MEGPLRTRALLDALPFLFAEKDTADNFVRVNRAFAELLGSTADAIGGTPAARWFPDQAAELHAEEVEVLRSGTARRGKLEHLCVGDGRRVWVRTDRIPLRDRDGEVRGLFVFHHVAEPIETGKTLERSRNTLRSVLATGPDVILVLTASGRYDAVFSTGRAGLIAPAEVLEGANFHDLLPAEAAQGIQAVIDRTLSSGELQEYEYALRVDGEMLTFSARVVPLDYGQEDAVLWSARDITEQKRAEEERRQLELGMCQAQKLESLGVLAGGIAHDFNNLLVGILGNVDMVLDDMAPGSRHHGMLDAARDAAIKAADLCQQMLAYSGKGSFVVGLVDLGNVIRDARRLLLASTSGRGRLDISLAEDLPLLEGDRTQLLQVVMNLVSNAAEALGDGDGTVTLRTGCRDYSEDELARARGGPPQSAGRYVYFEVSDDGEGMDAETVERMFDPFFTTKFTGRGLGLAAVLGIVRGHDGAIFVDSAPGRGSTIRVLCPVAEAEVEEFTPRPASRGPVVLVVDDDDLVRRVAIRALERAGYSALSARSGQEALRCVEESGDMLGAVLLDLTMPGMNGHQVFEAIRERDASLPVFFMSGFTERQALSSGAAQTVTGFIQKPFRPNELVETVAAAFRTPEPESP